MKTYHGRIAGFAGSVGSGIASLVVDVEQGYRSHIPCENAPTMRALRSAFGDRIVGQGISFEVDELGILTSFTPAGEGPYEG